MDKAFERSVIDLCLACVDVHKRLSRKLDSLTEVVLEIEPYFPAEFQTINQMAAGVDVRFNGLLSGRWSAAKFISDDALDICLRAAESNVALTRSVGSIVEANPDQTFGTLIRDFMWVALVQAAESNWNRKQYLKSLIEDMVLAVFSFVYRAFNNGRLTFRRGSLNVIQGHRLPRQHTATSERGQASTW